MPTFYIYPLIITKNIKNFINIVHYSIHQIVFRQNWNHRGSIHWTTCSSSHWSLRTTLLIWKNVSTPWTNMEISLTQQKCMFRVASGEFFGYIFTQRGIKGNPKKSQIFSIFQKKKLYLELIITKLQVFARKIKTPHKCVTLFGSW